MGYASHGLLPSLIPGSQGPMGLGIPESYKPRTVLELVGDQLVELKHREEKLVELRGFLEKNLDIMKVLDLMRQIGI